jgi:hypothetical protein
MSIAIAALLASVSVLPATSHGVAERTVFTCRSGAYVASVARLGDVLAYRSTHRGGLELQVSRRGGVSHMGYSGGGELQAAFVNGPWTYVVYQRTVRTSFSGTNDARFEAGVDVVRNGRVVSRRRCDVPSIQFDDAGLRGLPEAWFIEH